MAKFTSTSDLNIRWNGLDLSGSAGTELRIPDALYEEFDAAYANLIPGLTWTTTDEIADGTTLPIAQTDVTGLTAALAGKVAIAGDTMSGTLQSPRLQAKGAPWHDVRAYGATGDGATDDTAAFTAAIAAIGATAAGVIYVPKGTYRITSALAMGLSHSLVGDGSNASIITTTQTTGVGISWTGATTGPETGWAIRFRIEGVQVAHSGSGAAISLAQCIYVRMSDVKAVGSGATGDGIDIINSYVITLVNVRASLFPSGRAIRFRSTGVTQPGQFHAINCQGAYSIAGIEVSSTSGIIDAVVLENFICTDNTSVGVNIGASAGGGIWNVTSRNLHIESGIASNDATGVIFGGGLINMDFSDSLIWTQKKVIDASTSTCRGMVIRNLYMNANNHTAQGTALSFGSGVTALELGYVLNSSTDPYTTLISDSSDQNSRRKFSAGARTVVQAASSTIALTQAYQDVPGTSVTATPTLPEIWEVEAVIDYNNTSTGAGLLLAHIVFDTTTASGFALFDGSSLVTRLTAPITPAVFTASPGVSHTVKLIAAKSNAGGTAEVRTTNTALILRRTGMGA